LVALLLHQLCAVVADYNTMRSSSSHTCSDSSDYVFSLWASS